MSKDAIIIVLGLLVAAMPFLGFPGLWERGLLVLMGIAIAVLAFLLRGDMLRPHGDRIVSSSDVYVENEVSAPVKVARKKKDDTQADEAI